MGELTPSENEWVIMEVLWESETPLTAGEIIRRLSGIKDVSPKTIRVLINRLLKKKIVDYQVDEKDARVYHYYAVRSREACLEEKSVRFLNSYFRGNPLGMVATLVQNQRFSKEQMEELIEILKSGTDDKEGKQNE